LLHAYHACVWHKPPPASYLLVSMCCLPTWLSPLPLLGPVVLPTLTSRSSPALVYCTGQSTMPYRSTVIGPAPQLLATKLRKCMDLTCQRLSQPLLQTLLQQIWCLPELGQPRAGKMDRVIFKSLLVLFWHFRVYLAYLPHNNCFPLSLPRTACCGHWQSCLFHCPRTI
jgi:hypothetical protein